MSNPTRWRARRRLVATGATATDVYVPLAAGEVLELRQLRVTASVAAEVIVYFSSTTAVPAAATAIPEDAIIFGANLAANGGASPDVGCIGAWAPSPGQRVRVWVSAAGTYHVAAEGIVSE